MDPQNPDIVITYAFRRKVDQLRLMNQAYWHSPEYTHSSFYQTQLTMLPLKCGPEFKWSVSFNFAFLSLLLHCLPESYVVNACMCHCVNVSNYCHSTATPYSTESAVYLCRMAILSIQQTHNDNSRCHKHKLRFRQLGMDYKAGVQVSVMYKVCGHNIHTLHIYMLSTL